MEKFLEFQHKVAAVDPALLVEYTKRNKLSPDDIVLLFWLLSVTYSEISAVYLFNDIKENKGWENVTESYINEYWKINKPILAFGSARRYAKNMDWFPVLIIDFVEFTQGKPYEWILSMLKPTPEDSYRNLYKFLMNRKFMGRFSVELFLMNFQFFYVENLLDINIQEPVEFNWKTYSNETSGLLNIFYKDKEANEFDKSKSLSPQDSKFLDEALEILRQEILERYGELEAQYLMFMPRICTFRNFCKGMRYVGFHHDRQLRFINQYIKHKPNDPIWNEIFDIRSAIFPHELLGELHDWNDIRPERKKMFLTTGMTGAEIVK